MAIKGDFISFTYNGVHSTELGVMRVTSSNRYTDALLPTIQDKTVQVPGGNGTYFFGSYYTQRQIIINVAFDEVTENQIRLMRKTFGDQLSHELIFDDEPYKVYYAKTTGTPQLQYVPFSSPRVYKGEGTFSFTCYDPFAHTPNQYKYLDKWGTKINIDIFEQGKINSSDGVEAESPYRIRSIDSQKIPVLSNTQYTLSSNLLYFFIFRYDSNKNFISITDNWRDNNTSFNSGANTKYIRIVLANDKGGSPNIKVTPNDLKYINIRQATVTPSWYKYYNEDEWNLSANLLESKGDYDTYDSSTGFQLYNPGDVETDFKFKISTDGNFSISGIKVSTNNNLESRTLNVSINSRKGSDVFIQFNSKTNLIEGLKSNGTRSGNLYNDKIISGSWFKIPLTTDGKWSFQPLVYTGDTPTLEYDYLYF